MGTIMKLAQGSPEWEQHRRKFFNASETPAVLQLSPWITRYQLWLFRTGRTQQEVTAPMLHGSKCEAAARTAYEAMTGNIVEPAVMVDGGFSASLDGISIGGDLIAEFKVPYKGRASSLWQDAEVGHVPAHYVAQVQHQLLVSQAKLAHFFVFDGKEGLLLEVRPEPDYWEEIRAGWDDFARYLTTDCPPPLCERDSVLREDPEWRSAAERFVAAKRLADQASTDLDAAKTALVALSRHASEKGGGVSVSRVWRSTVDWKRLAQAAGLDPDGFKQPLREEVRVSVVKA